MLVQNAEATKVWDIHHHWVNEAGYIDRLLREMDRLGIERTGLIAMGPVAQALFVTSGQPSGCADNQDLAKLIERHGDRFWGYGYIRPGHATDQDVDRLAEMGMKGLKFHLPLKPYGDPEYLPLYARALEHELPCLFHTGIFYPPAPMPGQGIRSENCRPIHLEPIAQELPDLPIIAAHFGVCWTEEAAALCRICPNIHADLSGRTDGWRSSKPPEWFRQMLYWPEAHKKILFGSDVHLDELEDTLTDQRRICGLMGWSPQQCADVFGRNAIRIFGQETS